MSSPPSPPPWPIPPAWQMRLPAPTGGGTKRADPAHPATRTGAAAPVDVSSSRTIAVLITPGSALDDAVAAASPDGVTVDPRPLPSLAPSFAGLYDLARATGEALDDGTHGVVIPCDPGAVTEAAWALELMHAGDAPVVLAAPADLPDAVAVAAGGPPALGCVIVSRGEIHSARHVGLTGGAFLASPGAGPLGHVTAGVLRLLWRPPQRFTVRGPFARRLLRVGLYTVAFGDDGELPRALSALCDGLVVTAPYGSDVPDPVATVLTEAADRIPVIAADGCSCGLPATGLHPAKARVLMHLLLDAGRDRDGVLAAFAALNRGAPARL